MTLRLLAALAVTSALFLALPGLDLWISGLFHDGSGFPLAKSEVIEAFRNVVWSASIVVALGALALWIVWLPLGTGAAVPGRLWGWLASVYLLGPGLLVNGLLKEHIGRARPAYVFSGEADFSRAFAISDQCERNCSFVSGEAAGAAALAIVTGALLWTSLSVRGRRRAVIVLGAISGAASAMRILTGRHFLSDVVLAWLLTAVIALTLWHVMRIGPARDALAIATLRADVRSLVGKSGQRWRRLAG